MKDSNNGATDYIDFVVNYQGGYPQFRTLIQMEGSDVIRLTSRAGVLNLSRSLQYGRTIFEGQRDDRIEWSGNGGSGVETCMFHCGLNLMRMREGAGEFDFRISSSIEELTIAHARLIVLNDWLDGIRHGEREVNTIYGRPFMSEPEGDFIGVGGDSAKNVTTILLPFPSYFKEGTTEKGVAVVLTETPRNLTNPTIKVATNYLMPGAEKNRWDREYPKWVKGRPGWAEKYPTVTEVIFTNREGKMNEGSAENLAIVKGNTIVTPTVESGCLPGFTMQVIERIARELGYDVRREDFTPDEMMGADAVFMTGNAAGMVAIDFVAVPNVELKSGINGKEFNSSGNGIFRKLKAEYDKLLSSNNAYSKWDMWLSPRRELLHPEEIAYLGKVRKRMLTLGEGTGAVVTKSDLADIAIKKDIMMRLQPVKLMDGAIRRMERQVSTYRNMGFVYK